MPVTILSHQAVVLPLKLRWPHLFSGLALCIGSMVPDLTFIAQMTDDSWFSHDILPQIWFTAPITMLLVALISGVLVPHVLPYLPEIPLLRLHDLSAMQLPRSKREWFGVALSGWIGGMSHIFVDAMTHGNHSGFLVPHMPFLRTMVPGFGGSMPLYDALQLWLSVLFGIATVLMWRRIAKDRLLWRWRTLEPQPARTKPKQSGVMVARLCLFAAMLGGLIGFVYHRNDGMRAIVIGIAFGALDFVFGVLVLAGIRQAMRSPSGAASVPQQVTG